ncbi:MAG: hypothetical protein AAGA74_16200 [Pseudomonadota bacterium]
MFLEETKFLLDIETERLLRKQSRTITFPNSGLQTVEAYAVVWQFYDRLLAYRHGAGEERIKQNWAACMAEEGLCASDALVRLVHVYLERIERVGLDITESSVVSKVAQRRRGAWVARKARRQTPH